MLLLYSTTWLTAEQGENLEQSFVSFSGSDVDKVPSIMEILQFLLPKLSSRLTRSLGFLSAGDIRD